jgi:hypothetical protein
MDDVAEILGLASGESLGAEHIASSTLWRLLREQLSKASGDSKALRPQLTLKE